jgi:hypothetical protein
MCRCVNVQIRVDIPLLKTLNYEKDVLHRVQMCECADKSRYSIIENPEL